MTHHHHPHPHCSDPGDYNHAFALGVGLNAAYILLEAGFGLWVGSLALLADAGHNLSDVLGLLLAWGASYLMQIRPTKRRTYGWRSSSILAALFNAQLLMIAMGAIVWESVQRFRQPDDVPGGVVIVVAAVGVVINGVTAWLFVKGSRSDLNIRGAFLHMAADALVSLGVVLAGVGIYFTGWNWIDPTTSLIVAAVIIVGTWGLLRDSINLALHAVPKGIDPQQVYGYLEGLPDVKEIHDLHIWAMSTTETALTAHLIRNEAAIDDLFLHRVDEELQQRFGITHSTLQLETGQHGADCRHAPPDVV